MTPLTIGVFDSGFGGLTVLRALLPLIPNANYIYLGDTARLPYGSKSHETIARYAVSSAKFLHEQGANLLVIACNTATALALEDIQHALPIPVIGVVEPGANAAHSLSSKNSGGNLPCHPERSAAESKDLRFARLPEPPQLSNQPEILNSVILSEAKNRCILLDAATISPHRVPHVRDSPIVANVGEISPQNQVLVLATTATVQSHAYTHALNALGLQAYEKACPLLVPLVEEGWINHPVTDEVLRIYLTEALTAAPATHTLLLGCTHYPLLEPAIRRTLASMGHSLAIIDSAQATAHAVAAHPALASHLSDLKGQSCLFYATDSVEKFQRLGSAFLGQPVTGVRHIDLGG
ncbi:MAG TPA: aspartate/glutamate racemase family protein [Edaphobacter sp.]|jgi:glutamate racemase|nr:aspartate/glutamate racemase family protein [Edaphobacter sp.]